MRNRGCEKESLKDTLKINDGELPSCNVSFSHDCLDQTVLNIEFPFDMQKEGVESLSEHSSIVWVTDNMFIVDRPCFYRLIGCVGNKDLNVRFRIFNLDPLAWDTLKEAIRNILVKNGVMVNKND